MLKLTGVITWSWWWVVLSPLWISPALLTLAITALAIQPVKQAKPWLADEEEAQIAPSTGASDSGMDLADP